MGAVVALSIILSGCFANPFARQTDTAEETSVFDSDFDATDLKPQTEAAPTDVAMLEEDSAMAEDDAAMADDDEEVMDAQADKDDSEMAEDGAMADEEEPTALPTVMVPTTAPEDEDDQTPEPSTATAEAIIAEDESDDSKDIGGDETDATAGNESGVQNVVPASADACEHVVEKGQNLFRIGLAYNIPWDVLQLYNALSSGDSIQAGQVILLPNPGCNSAPAAAPELGGNGGDVTHVVQLGENLFRIGLKYNMTWDILVAANPGIDPNNIKAGDRLQIPANGIVSNPAPTATPAPANNPTATATQSVSIITATPTAAATSTEAPATNTGTVDAEDVEISTNGLHVVQPGETLSILSAAYDIPLANWVAENPGVSDENIIFIGQVLTVPGSSTSGPIITATASGASSSTATNTPTAAVPTIGATATTAAAGTDTPTPAVTSTPTAASSTDTPTPAVTNTPTLTPTPNSASSGATATNTPITPTVTNTPAVTNTPTNTATATNTRTPTPTNTTAATNTNTPTSTTAAATNTPTRTNTPTSTATLATPPTAGGPTPTSAP